MPSPVLGIDLGTTNSVVAYADEHRVRVLRDEDGQLITPSTVSFDPSGRRLVGHEARERRLVDARNTIFSVKRLLGRPFRSPEVQRAAARLPFQLEEGATGGVQVRVRGETFSLPEIASFILRKVRSVAEAALGMPCVNAVITVPANFNELQRMATRDAGRIAGLNVLRILNEPTAAALAYGYRAKQGQRIAVYDLGGGTFDISILELSGDVIEVVATAGDTNLGGDDLDGVVADRMVAEFNSKYGQDLTREPQQYERVRMAAEWIKCQLSHQDTAEAIVKEVAWGAGKKPLDLHFRLSRAELQQLVAPLITRTFTSCEEALRLANVHPVQLDGVILVGGQTRTPAVRDMVGSFFGREPLSSVDPELVVAQGAALQGYALSGVPAAELPSKPGRTLKNGAPAPQPPPPAAAPVAPAPAPRKRSEIPFEDLPTTVSFRADPDEELTKVGEYVSAEEADAMFAAAQQNESLANTLSGVGPQAKPANETNPIAATARAVVAPGAAVLRAQLDASAARASAAGSSRAPRVSLPPSRVPPPPPKKKAQAAAPAPIDLEDVDDLPAALREAEEAVANATSRPPANDRVPEVTAPLRKAKTAKPEATPEPPVSAPPAFDEAEAVATDARTEAKAEPHEWRSSDAPVDGLSLPTEAALNDSSLFLSESQLLRSQFPGPPSQAPLLLDVTPHTLAVETTGGFCEPIIDRNAPIPTEQTRVFSTSMDDQVTVRVRVCQGESRRTDENQVLGHVELIGLRKARRGEVSIAVTFIIDADGALNVNAVDRTTGHGQAIRVDLVGAIGDRDIEQMRLRHRSLRPR